MAAPRETCRSAGIGIETLTPREAFVELIKGTFNRRLVSPQRLTQQFRVMSSLASRVSIRKLTYPRAIDRLHEVRRTVIADLIRDVRVG